MRHFCIFGLVALLLAALPVARAHAQDHPPTQGTPAQSAPAQDTTDAGAFHIEWEVKNRFRLFRSEADFQRQVAAYRDDGVLGAERRLEIGSDGRGWARDTVERLCLDR